VAATALVFGLAHGALWLPGTLAGVAFGLLVDPASAVTGLTLLAGGLAVLRGRHRKTQN